MKGLIWVLLEKFGLASMSMLVAFWYAILLGPEGFGTASMFLATALLLSAIQGNMQRNPLLAVTEDFSIAMHSSIKGWLVISIITGLILYVGMILYWGVEYNAIIFLCALYLPISTMSKALLAELLRSQEYKTIALRSVSGKFAGIVVGVLLAYSGHVTLAIIAQCFVDLLVQTVVMVKRSKIFRFQHLTDGFSRDERALFFSMFKEGIPSGLTIIDIGFKTKGAILLLGVLIGPYAAGVFTLAMKLVDVPRTMIGFGVTTWAVGKFKARVGQQEALREVYALVTLIGFMVLFPAYFGMIAIAEPLIHQFFGQEWHEAIFITQLVCVYYFLSSYQVFVQPLLIVTKNTHKTVKATIVSAVITLAGGALCVPFFGLYSIVIALYISLIPIFYQQEIEVTRLIGVNSIAVAKSTLMILVSSLVMCVLVVYSNQEMGLDSLIMLIAIGGLLYCLLLSLCLVFGLINKSKLRNALVL